VVVAAVVRFPAVFAGAVVEWCVVVVGFLAAAVLDEVAVVFAALWAGTGVVVWAVTWASSVRNDKTPASAATNLRPEHLFIIRKPTPLRL
jgi:hypothetical protein